MDRKTSLTNTRETLEKADNYIQHLLELGISKLTKVDETDIQQYKQEQLSSAYWGIRKDDL